jgi:hypothetical protein
VWIEGSKEEVAPSNADIIKVIEQNQSTLQMIQLVGSMPPADIDIEVLRAYSKCRHLHSLLLTHERPQSGEEQRVDYKETDKLIYDCVTNNTKLTSLRFYSCDWISSSMLATILSLGIYHMTTIFVARSNLIFVCCSFD